MKPTAARRPAVTGSATTYARVCAELLGTYALEVLAVGVQFVWNFASRKILLFRRTPLPPAVDSPSPQVEG